MKKVIDFFLGANFFLVILSYTAANLFGMWIVDPLKNFKIAFMLFSLLVALRVNSGGIVGLIRNPLFLSGLFIIPSVIFSTDIMFSGFRYITYIVPIAFLIICFRYLLKRYSIEGLIHYWVRLVNFIYFLPLLAFFFIGDLSETNIYGSSGETDETVLSSNNLAWAGVLFLLTSLDMINHGLIKSRFGLIFILLFSVVSFYVILIAGNRTSYLIMILTLLFYFFRFKGGNIFTRYAAIVGMVFGVIWFVGQEGNAITNRLEKTEVQLEEGEARVEYFKTGLDFFGNNPEYWISGIGFMDKIFLDQELRLNGFHNSYAEVLFGSGVIVFVIFFFYYLIQPFVFFVRYVQKHYVSFFPIFIYPFFESNLTSGQFIYWPWMSGVILLYFIRKRMLH